MPAEKVLEINGEVTRLLSLSLDDICQLNPANSVQTGFLRGVRRHTITFVGARLWDAIGSAQPHSTPTSTLRLMARARDGFRCIIRWHEFDPTLTHHIVLVAYEQDGQLLTADGGPLRLVVPGDERGRRFLRGLAQLTILAPTTEDE